MTFCKSDCQNTNCFRYLSDQVCKDARAWWGGEGAPIALSDFSTTCPDYEGDKNGQESV